MIDKILLFPYALTLAIRDLFYRKGWKKSHRAEVPTVSVGNITVGGTGKTPHVEMILRVLQQSDDWAYSNIAVLSRGYKRQSKGFQKVSRDGTAARFGDEPLQIAKKFPAVTVAVDKDRIEGCRFLCHPEELQTSKKARKCVDKDIPAAGIIVLDDAFQYRRLKASVNIVLVDFYRPVHKDMLLPLGHLRDLPKRLRDADILIVTKCPPYMDEWEKGKWASNLGLRDYSTSTCTGRNALGRRQILLFSYIGYRDMKPVFGEEADSRYMYAQRLVLFSGIAKDTPLRNYLSDKYKIVKHFHFPDHHKYTAGDLRTISAAVHHNPTAVVATTEKDAQRIVDTKKVPDSLKERLFEVPIDVNFLTENEKAVFETTLLGFLHPATESSTVL